MSGLNSTAQIEYRQIGWLPGYRFGSDASVWSDWIKGSTTGSRRPEGPDRWKRLKPTLPSSTRLIKYFSVSLTCDGRQKRCSVHRLIAEAFLGPCPDGMQVCHNDGNPLNCVIGNLRYGTPQENSDDVDRHGTRYHGEQHYLAKLSPGDIPTIRARHDAGESYSVIAADYGVAFQTIYDVVKRRTWRHVS